MGGSQLEVRVSHGLARKQERIGLVGEAWTPRERIEIWHSGWQGGVG